MAISDCMSCRMRSRHALPYPVFHPMEILAGAYLLLQHPFSGVGKSYRCQAPMRSLPERSGDPLPENRFARQEAMSTVVTRQANSASKPIPLNTFHNPRIIAMIFL